MIYTENQAAGHAGEYFFAYKIARELKWPCRLIGIDIGIDAQVEVLDVNQVSTGQFVAFQVKAWANTNCIPVSPRHLKYWKELSLPVYLVLVSLAKQEMYVRYIDPNETHSSETKCGDIPFYFDFRRDLFSKGNAVDFREKSRNSAAVNLDGLLTSVLASAKKIKEIAKETDKNSRWKVVGDLVAARCEMQDQVDRAQALVVEFKIKELEFSKAQVECNEAWAAVQDIVVNCREEEELDGNG